MFVLEPNGLLFKTNDYFDKYFIINFKTVNKIMLTFNFSRIFKARGIDKPFTFLVKSGYSGNFATSIVNSRHDKLNLKDVERLCELFQCTPNDLLEWIPNGKDANNGKHPLISLKRNDDTLQLAKMLRSIPIERLGDIEMLIRKEIEK